jgi:3-oxoacyl-(acyl-carrier-protein) synthase
MRRVAVTGLGAVTPLGNDVASTWRAATAGESGIDWIRSFDPGDAPVRVAAEVKDFDASQVASPKEVRKLERNVLLALGAAREALDDSGLNGFDPARVLTGSRRTFSRTSSSILRAASSRSRWGSRGRTTRWSPPAQPGHTQSERRPS